MYVIIKFNFLSVEVLRKSTVSMYAFFFRNCFWWMNYDTANANFSARVEKNLAKLFKMDFSTATDRSAPYLLLPDFSWKQCGPIWISGNSLTPDRVWPQFEPGWLRDSLINIFSNRDRKTDHDHYPTQKIIILRKVLRPHLAYLLLFTIPLKGF